MSYSLSREILYAHGDIELALHLMNERVCYSFNHWIQFPMDFAANHHRTSIGHFYFMVRL